MSAKRSQENVLVRRITVDEQLADDLVRLLVCPLAQGVQEFFDRDEEWGEEEEVWVKRGTYTQDLGIPPAKEKDCAWEELAEGQVFLSGEFEIVGCRAAPKYFKVSPGREEFLRIDGLEGFREGIKRIYSDLLARR